MQLTQTARRVINRQGYRYIFGWGAKRLFGLLTRSMRVLPDFIIIGAQRCGSTSLYNYLIKHQEIIPGLMKEVHFFDYHFQKGPGWYRSFFPRSTTLHNPKRDHQEKYITGEATPNYLFYPHAARRVHTTLPSVKLIVLLRNPVDRAYSHYNYEVKLGVEDLPFSEAIQREKTIIPLENSKVMGDESYKSFDYQNYSYLSRGKYIEQLEIWNKYFSMKDILVLKSEDLFFNPAQVLEKTYQFLGLKKYSFPDFEIYNSLTYQNLDREQRNLLTAYFEPYNNRLYKFLGVNFEWENSPS